MEYNDMVNAIKNGVKYDYRVEIIYSETGLPKAEALIESTLNKYGSTGWKLFNISYRNALAIMVFEKPRADEILKLLQEAK